MKVDLEKIAKDISVIASEMERRRTFTEMMVYHINNFTSTCHLGNNLELHRRFGVESWTNEAIILEFIEESLEKERKLRETRNQVADIFRKKKIEGDMAYVEIKKSHFEGNNLVIDEADILWNYKKG
jgi:hypothetical protein